MTYPSSATYNGTWKANKRHGRGTYTQPNGDAYTGAWLGGVKHGAGRYRHAGKTRGRGRTASSSPPRSTADGSSFFGKFPGATTSTRRRRPRRRAETEAVSSPG